MHRSLLSIHISSKSALVLGELGGRCTLLNATVAGQPLYESLGFKAIGTSFTSIRGFRCKP
jgi:hypothetical protein